LSRLWRRDLREGDGELSESYECRRLRLWDELVSGVRGRGWGSDTNSGCGNWLDWSWRNCCSCCNLRICSSIESVFRTAGVGFGKELVWFAVEVDDVVGGVFELE